MAFKATMTRNATGEIIRIRYYDDRYAAMQYAKAATMMNTKTEVAPMPAGTTWKIIDTARNPQGRFAWGLTTLAEAKAIVKDWPMLILEIVPE